MLSSLHGNFTIVRLNYTCEISLLLIWAHPIFAHVHVAYGDSSDIPQRYLFLKIEPLAKKEPFCELLEFILKVVLCHVERLFDSNLLFADQLTVFMNQT